MRYVWVFTFLFLAASISFPFFVLPRILRIHEIDCQSQFGPCSEALEQKIKGMASSNGNFLETKKMLTSFLENEILVDDFSFQFKLPNRLEVNVLERKPKFALQSKERETLALVDSRGYIIYFEDLTALPRLITVSSLPNVGEKLDGKTLFALELVYDMFSFYQVQEGKLEADSLVIELPTGPRVIFPLEGDRKTLLGSLRLILAKLNSDSQGSRIEDMSGVSIIDLRFKNPVLK